MFCFVDVPSQFGASLRAELMGLGKNPQIPYTRRTRRRATVQGFHSASRHVKLQVQDPENDFTNIWKRLETARLQSLKCLHSVYSILSFAWKAMIWFHRPRWSDAGHQSVWGHLEKSSQALEQIPSDSSVRFHPGASCFFIPFHLIHPFPSFFPCFRGFNPWLLAALAQMCEASHALSLYQITALTVLCCVSGCSASSQWLELTWNDKYMVNISIH